LWGRIVVDDRVDHFSIGTCSSIVLSKRMELLMAMALHVAADDGTLEDR
jgi:hypothetical protein